MIYLVIWKHGQRHTYSDEASARKLMLYGDKLFSIDLVTRTVREIV